jgi:hypothetical protein
MLIQDMSDMSLAHIIVTLIGMIIFSPLIYAFWKTRKKCSECAKLNGIDGQTLFGLVMSAYGFGWLYRIWQRKSNRMLEMCKVKL